jgi:hypothetical protein
MSHPDEGLIHTWLDDELDDAEAARVEALVRDDPAWAAAAAEARGFIAASSRIAGMLDDVPANVLPPKMERPTAPQVGIGTVTPLRRAAERGAPWWAMRVAALLVVATGTVLVVQRVSPDMAAELADRAPNQPALTQSKQAVPSTPAGSGAATAPKAAQTAAPAAAPAAAPPTAASRAAAPPAAAPAPTGTLNDALKDARSGTRAPAVGLNEADALRRPAPATAKAKANANAPAAEQSRRDRAEPAKLASADEKRVVALDATIASTATELKKEAAGATAGAVAKTSATAGQSAASPATAALRAAPERTQPINAISREECYREPADAAGAAPAIHHVGRTGDSTAIAGALLGFRSQTNQLRQLSARQLPATMRVHGDTLFIGVVNGVARMAMRISCPAP